MATPNAEHPQAPGAAVAIDPAVPASTRRLIATTPLVVLRRPDPKRVPGAARALARPGSVAALVLAGSAALSLITGRVADVDAAAGSVTELASRLAAAVRGALILPTMLTVALCGVWGLVEVLRVKKLRADQRTLVAARRQYVLVDYLPPRSRQLLERAQEAADTVRRSTVHREDLLDRARAELLLDEHLWEVAQALRDHADLAEDLPDLAESDEVRDTARQLREALAGVEARIAALETYAGQVAATDLVYAVTMTTRTPTPLRRGQDERLRDLKARSVRDELAIEDLHMAAAATAAVHRRLAEAGPDQRAEGAAPRDGAASQ